MSNASGQRRQAGYSGGSRSGGAAAQKRMFGKPDWFLVFPLLGLFLAAFICAVLAASTIIAVVLVLIGVVLVVADSWLNR
ncbi:hypothetical protein ACIP5Y_25530 [Nocardia sp. NPDC088792]|uniref:hypothetical protein n=1 Tax=Nocardia sp. NPDC088792 TaxID=3364332 RepID=UPI0037F8E29A